MDTNELDTESIKRWRSIVTLVVFVITNVIVLFPFQIPIFVPRQLAYAALDALAFLRVIKPRRHEPSSPVQHGPVVGEASHDGGSITKPGAFVRLEFPMNFLTAPIIADLFLLAISAIGRQEVVDGTIGTNHIHPYDIMLFFISLAYIAISIDASGLIRYLAFKVLIWGGDVGHRLFFYLYAFFFALGTFIGNDPIILSGTAFLAYMTRVSSNIKHPRAWIYTQFAIANVASATLVSSNPTNLVLAGAFSIRFIDYTANMVVPVVATAIILFPFLLYIIFPDPALIPHKITLHALPEAAREKRPVNPNIPNARGDADEAALENNDEHGKLLSLEEIMNPYLDKKSAGFGGVVMAVTLITLLALNAAHTQGGQEQPVFYVTLPAAVVMLCWDMGYGWLHRKETREIAKKGRRDIEQGRARRAEDRAAREQTDQASGSGTETNTIRPEPHTAQAPSQPPAPNQIAGDSSDEIATVPQSPTAVLRTPTDADLSDKDEAVLLEKLNSASTATQPAAQQGSLIGLKNSVADEKGVFQKKANGTENPIEAELAADPEKQPDTYGAPRQATLASFVKDRYTWCQETFPTTMAVLAHLPLALIPFAFAMFVLVQALVSSGWVPIFAYGWARWVEKTGTVGAVGGMGFLSVILCNFSGTNIGTTILLCRVVQAWTAIARAGQTHITERTYWATVYSMAIGVNYGAFSTAFSASLAGMLWRDILARKHIHVRGLDFARINVPIIAVSMIIGCVVLIGEVWITRDESPYV
ncbi:hypothetical protein RB595_008387 [Gaeumannomyces hyphopodioides]